MNLIVEKLKVAAMATAVALVVYGLTQPDGLPWGAAVRWPMAWIGASVAAGFVAELATRHFGWRVGIAAALGWIFFPRIWNSAVLGGRFAVFASSAAVAIWILDGIFYLIFGNVRKMRSDCTTPVKKLRRDHLNRLMGNLVLGTAMFFVAVSALCHDYRLGSAATKFVRGVIRVAGDRIIVLNGVCDEQVLHELAADKGRVARNGFAYLSPSFADYAYRDSILNWVRTEWPAETNLVAAAHIGVSAFIAEVVKAHPERFYVMSGGSGTYESWLTRWREFAPYLGSRDQFVNVARRAFAYEANWIANKMGESEAWKLYWRILNEVEPRNVSTLINLSVLMRNGHAATDIEKLRIKNGLAEFWGDRARRRHVREFVRAAGLLKCDGEFVERLASEHRSRLEAALASDGKVALAGAAKQVIEWNNEMVRLMNGGEVGAASRYARMILSQPKFRSFIPANTVMGMITAMKGDYAAAESFFRMATDTTNRVPVVVLNDYADTLMQVGKLDEAEKFARRAIREAGEAGEKDWLPRRTLEEILTKKSGGDS